MATRAAKRKIESRDIATYRPGPAVQEFLDEMARALTSGDGEAAARLWSLPAVLVGDDLVEPVTSKEQLAKMFGGAKAQYNAIGITDTRGEIERLEWLTDRIAVVHVRWPHLDAEGEEHGEESSSYLLRRDDDGRLKLHVAILRGMKQDGAQHRA